MHGVAFVFLSCFPPTSQKLVPNSSGWRMFHGGSCGSTEGWKFIHVIKNTDKIMFTEYCKLICIKSFSSTKLIKLFYSHIYALVVSINLKWMADQICGVTICKAWQGSDYYNYSELNLAKYAIFWILVPHRSRSEFRLVFYWIVECRRSSFRIATSTNDAIA